VNFNVSALPLDTASLGEVCHTQVGVMMPIYDGTFIPVAAFGFDAQVVEPAELTCFIPVTQVGPGKAVTVNGMVTPASGQTIALVYADWTGKTEVRNVVTQADGKFTDTFKTNITCVWNVQAMWIGDDTHAPIKSTPCQFTVVDSGNSGGQPPVSYCSQFTSFGECSIAHSDKCTWADDTGTCVDK
jgi:hypothetical protein